MRRRWFFLGGIALFLVGLWVLDARPSDLLLNEGGKAAAGDFLSAALRPAFDYQDEELRGGDLPFLGKVAGALWLTLRYAIAAMSLALVFGILGGVSGSRAWWSRSSLALEVLRVGVRLLATAVRSVHELIWALLFLSAVGTSPLAAVLAMALPYGGTLAKVFSELLDEGESSAAQVLRLAGGGGFAAFLAGVVTRALPDLATYALYRLECAIRSSAVLGFVGIPTIGYEIKTAYEDGHYQEIWTYLYVLLAVVMAFEWWGGKVREKLTVGVKGKLSPKGASLAELWSSRGRSHFVRASVVILAGAGVLAWTVENQWGAGVGWEQRLQNLERFTSEIVPYPVREAGGDWGAFWPWFSELMTDRGVEAVWRTFHLGTAAILLAGLVALIGIRYAARTLTSARPRGVRDGPSGLRKLVAWGLQGASMLGRAMPEYILAFLLLRVFGPTVWALILALAIHNGGILLRLGAEVVDNTVSRSSTVILAQGGSRSMAYLGALLPTSFNRLVLFLFYRWESCIREATVLGTLGVASLGFLISDAKVAFFYDEMLVWIVLGAGLVFVGDLASDWVRYRLRGQRAGAI